MHKTFFIFLAMMAFFPAWAQEVVPDHTLDNFAQLLQAEQVGVYFFHRADGSDTSAQVTMTVYISADSSSIVLLPFASFSDDSVGSNWQVRALQGDGLIAGEEFRVIVRTPWGDTWSRYTFGSKFPFNYFEDGEPKLGIQRITIIR